MARWPKAHDQNELVMQMSNEEKKSFFGDMTPKQKQAVIICAVCALAVVVTAAVTMVTVSGKIKAANGGSDSSQSEPTGGYDPTAYQIDPANTAVLAETADAGEEYLEDTLFIGDSNTVRFGQNGLLSVQQYCAKEGLGIQSAVSEKFIAFKNHSDLYAIPEAVAMMKPRRVVITLGTNNAGGSMSADSFISEYQTLISAIQTSYPYTDIIVNAVPPVPQEHSTYPDLSQETIDAFNMALAEMCQQLNVSFLNSAEALKGEDGYGKAEYFVTDDIHMKLAGLKALLEYASTHALDTSDRRPDMANIPERTEDYNSSTSATPPPTATPDVEYTAEYRVDKAGGGTLSSGGETGKTSFSFEITDKSDSITVKAVPADGMTFIKWSDGVTTATRTDKNFKQNVDVTAIFAEVGLKISGSATAEADKDYTLTASLTNSKYGDLKAVVWYIKTNDGEYKKQSIPGETYTFTVKAGNAYALYAVMTYNETEIKSNVVTLDAKATPTPTPTPSPSPSPTPEVTPSPSPSPVPTPEATPSPSPSPVPTPEPTPSPSPSPVPTPEPAADEPQSESSAASE